MNKEEERKPSRVKPSRAQSPCDGVALNENGPCIEFLQRTIAQLLMKNEKIRFELFVVREKIASIDRTVFGAGSRDLQKVLPATLLKDLRDLCCEEAGSSQHETAMLAATDSLMSFPSAKRPILRMHQTNGLPDRGK